MTPVPEIIGQGFCLVTAGLMLAVGIAATPGPARVAMPTPTRFCTRSMGNAAAKRTPAPRPRSGRVTSGLWYRAALTSEQLSAGAAIAIRERFTEAIDAAGQPDGACLFVATEEPPDDGPGSPEGADKSKIVAVFFSPVAVSFVPHLIALYGATPSPPPQRADAALVAGDQADWDLLPRSSH